MMITPPVVNDNIGTGGVYDALHKVIIHQHIIILLCYCYLLLLLVRGVFLIKCCMGLITIIKK